MNILVIRLSSIGDIVHTIPAVACLRRAYPESRITWVTGETTAPLLYNYPEIDRLITADEKKWLRMLRRGSLFAASRAVKLFVSELRSEHYDMVLDFQGLLKSSLIAACSRGKRKIGFANGREGSVLLYSEKAEPAHFYSHAIARHMGLIRHLGISIPPGTPGPLFGQEDEKKVLSLLEREGVSRSKPMICFHPWARWPTKIWKQEHISGLCERIHRELDCTVIFIGSREACRHVPAAPRDTSPDIKNFTGKTTLSELACLLSHADLVLSTDSGPMHIACAVGTPVAALFGPTSPERTGPFGTRDTVITKKTACSPCFAKTKCPEGHHRCMNDISVEEVFQVCCNYIQHSRQKPG